MVRGCKLERDPIACPRPVNSARPHPHHSSSSSCSLLTAPSHTRSEGSPMLAGLPVTCRAGLPPTPVPSGAGRSPPSPPPPNPVTTCSCCACYPRLVAKHPWIILLIVFLISSAALVALVALGEWPDFQTSPTEAFKTVNTPLSQRYEQFFRLASMYSAFFPGTGPDNSSDNVVHSSLPTVSPHSETRERVRRRVRRGRGIRFCMTNRELLLNLPRLSRLVVGVEDRQTDLLSLSALRLQCALEKRLRRLSAFKAACDRTLSGHCCRPWSLPNLVAKLGNRASCSDLQQAEVDEARKLLLACLGEYRAQPGPACWLGRQSCDLSEQCRSHAELLFPLLHVLLPQSSISPARLRLRRSLVVLPVLLADSSLGLYRQLRARNFLSPAGGVRVEGVHFGLANLLVDEVLQRDSRWLALGAGAIFLLVWASTGSLLVTACTHLLMGLSLLLAYAVYTLLFQLRHFPFVNMMSAVLAIAIGADDVFIYSRVWRTAKSDRRDATLARLVADSLRHAGVSILVTSLSTAAALFANACSRIIAVKCFAVYAGIVVLVNLLLVLACIPATWVLVERRSLWPCRGPPAWLSRLQRAVYTRVFVHALPSLVVRFRHVWTVSGLLLVVASLLVIFYKPGFTFSRSLQPVFFSGQHPSELYLRRQARLFDFERESRRRHLFVLRLVWGARPSDLRDPFASDSVAPLSTDPHFNPDSPAAQLWLQKLCRELHTAPQAVVTDPVAAFPDPEGKQVFVCPFSDSYFSFAEFASLYSCSNKTVPITKASGCCWRDRPFPYSRRDFHRCLMQFSRAARLHPLRDQGFRFLDPVRSRDTSRPLLAGLYLSVQTNLSRDAAYPDIAAWLARVNDWFALRLADAPPGLRGGFVTTDLRVFDLHLNIATSLPLTVALSVAMAATVCLLTSMNLLLAGLALLTVLGILAATVASFILLGWCLDIVESVVMTLAVGLAVDYCLHYGVAYRVCRVPSHQARPGDRQERARETLVSVGSPITAAALTTALAGVGMLPTQLLVYRQMALFLIILMAWAWFFSTFVFVSLLALLGPSYSCAQITCPRACADVLSTCSCALDRRVDKTVYSEAEVSSGTLRLETLAGDDVEIEPGTLRVSYSNHVLSGDGGGGLLPPAARPLGDSLVEARGTSNERAPRLTASTNDIWVKRSGTRPRSEVHHPLPDSYESLSNV